jgi:hypothetical protein
LLSKTSADTICVSLPFAAFAQEPDQVSPVALAGMKAKSAVVTRHAKLNGGAHARQGIPNVDSIVNFNGHFIAPGFDPFGNSNTHWYFNTVGNPPTCTGPPPSTLPSSLCLSTSGIRTETRE